MTFEATLIGELVDSGQIDIQTGPFGTQLRASDYVSEGTPVINVRNIGFGDLRPEKLEYVDDRVADRLSVHLLRVGDLVFGRKGAVDRHLMVGTAQHGWMQGSDCIRLRVLDQSVEPRFISYSFLRPEHQQWMLNQSGNRATMASLNHDIIRRIPIALPSREHQALVASILSAYDDLIENNRRRIQLLEESARLIYQEWFVRLRHSSNTCIGDSLPEGWRSVSLGSITTKIGSGATPRGGSSSYVSEGVTLIRSMNVYDDRFDEEGLAFIDERQADELSGVTVAAQDILINITGASVGRCCMASERFLPARVNQHVAIIRVAPGKASPFLVHAAINSDERKRQLLSYAQKGSTREALTKEMLERFEIMLPPSDVMERFEGIAKPSFELRENLSRQNQKLTSARDLLLPRLMSGGIEAFS